MINFSLNLDFEMKIFMYSYIKYVLLLYGYVISTNRQFLPLFLFHSKYSYSQVNSTPMLILTFLKEVKNLILQDAMAFCIICFF